MQASSLAGALLQDLRGVVVGGEEGGGSCALPYYLDYIIEALQHIDEFLVA